MFQGSKCGQGMQSVKPYGKLFINFKFFRNISVGYTMTKLQYFIY